jgi:carboxyl-terminal processing protease
MWRDADDEEIASLFLQSVARTYDPHSDYLSHREMESFRIGMTHELIGIGAQLQGDDDGATKIVGIVIGGPADREGTLKLNDRIVGVNTLATGRPEDMIDVMFMRIDKVTSLIRGQDGTRVALKIEPASGPPGETRIVVIQRGRVEMKDEQASGELIEILDKQQAMRRLGVITLPSFYADFDDGNIRCSVDMERILKRLVAEGIDGLMVDLRNNGGGSLDEVRRITGFFIPPGPVVQVKNAVGRAEARSSSAGKPLYNGPMVVATDRSSASASEILAGALQDYHRAVLVGDASTYGKGTVQQLQDISQKMSLWSARDRAGHIKLTIQKFYRPSGSSTQKEGVVPDIVLPSPADALEFGEAYLDRVLPHDRIAPAPKFRPGDRNHLFVERLLEESNARVGSSKDFSYLIEDVMKNSARIKANRLSLNIEKRRQEIAEAESVDRQRNRERRERFAKMAEEDRSRFRFFKITLDGLDQEAALQPYEPSAESEYMRMAKADEEELDDTPEWPTGIDPVKRESLHVLRDLVEVTETARMTGIIK